RKIHLRNRVQRVQSYRRLEGWDRWPYRLIMRAVATVVRYRRVEKTTASFARARRVRLFLGFQQPRRGGHRLRISHELRRRRSLLRIRWQQGDIHPERDRVAEGEVSVVLVVPRDA